MKRGEKGGRSSRKLLHFFEIQSSRIFVKEALLKDRHCFQDSAFRQHDGGSFSGTSGAEQNGGVGF